MKNIRSFNLMKERDRKKSVRFCAVVRVEIISYDRDSINHNRSDGDQVSKHDCTESACTGIAPYPDNSSGIACSVRANKRVRESDTLEETYHSSQNRKRQRYRVIQSVLVAQATARDHIQDNKNLDVERFIAYFATKESRNAKALAVLMGKEIEASVLQHEEFKLMNH